MTRTSNHTPGPMRVESDGTTIALGGQCVIMSPAPDGAGIEVERANAARIALAWNTHDEMLAALEWLLSMQAEPIHGDASDYGRRHEQARTALAKARGGGR